MNFHKRISENAKHITKLEKDLLRLLLENKNLFKYNTFTIENVAKEFSMSKTTVHRLSKKLSYNSFIQFKDDYFERSRCKKVEVEDETFLELLIDTYNLIKESPIDEIVDKLIYCKKVIIYGMGMSNYLSKIFQIKLQLLGIPTEQYDDSRFMRLSSRILNKDDDLVFMLSRSGETPELLEVLVETNLNGIDVVLITENRNSTFEKLCKYIVYTAFTQDLDNNIDTRLNFHIAMDYIVKKFVEKSQGRDNNI